MNRPYPSPALRHPLPLRSRTLFGKLCAFAERLWANPAYEPLLLLLSSVFLLNADPYGGFAAMGLVTCFMLVCCGDLLAALPPFLFACLTTTGFFDHYDVLRLFSPLFFAAILAIAAHFALYRTALTFGTFTAPLVCVSVSALLGGLGKISPKEYLSPLSLFYVFGLGFGMLLIYGALLGQFSLRRNYDLLEKLLRSVYYAGIFAAAVIFRTYLARLDEVLAAGSSVFISYRNFCATMILLALPCACLPGTNGKRHPLGMAILYLGALFTASRTALVFGTTEYLLCLLWLCTCTPPQERRRNRKNAARLALFMTLALLLLGSVLFSARLQAGKFIGAGESRVAFLRRGIEDFFHAPVFGWGLGNLKNSDIYYGVPGSLVWYHNLVVQILGSLGIAGGLSYGWLFCSRLRLLLSRRSRALVPAALTWCAMLCVSMTNPGEICPLPNAFLMVALFAAIETLPPRRTLPRPNFPEGVN